MDTPEPAANPRHATPSAINPSEPMRNESRTICNTDCNTIDLSAAAFFTAAQDLAKSALVAEDETERRIAELDARIRTLEALIKEESDNG